jgi:hypothetical protein
MQPGELAAPPLPTGLIEPLRAPSEIGPDVVVAGNRLRVFAESGPLMRSLVDDLGRATSRAWVESYKKTASETLRFARGLI